jgi:N-acetylglutamate synthase-like GNAT family acetyltransferase
MVARKRVHQPVLYAHDAQSTRWRLAASNILKSAYVSSIHPFISRIFQLSTRGQLHCYRAGRALEQKDIEKFRCSLTADGNVVAAACYRHTPRLRRASNAMHEVTEVFLLAVDDAEQGKGYGKAMVKHLNNLATHVHSKRLIVTVCPVSSHLPVQTSLFTFFSVHQPD